MRGTLLLRDPSYTVEVVSSEKRKSGFVPRAQVVILQTPGMSISCSSRKILISFRSQVSATVHRFAVHTLQLDCHLTELRDKIEDCATVAAACKAAVFVAGNQAFFNEVRRTP